MKCCVSTDVGTRDMDELITFEPDPHYGPDAAKPWYVEFYYVGKISRIYAYWRGPSLQLGLHVVLKWFYSLNHRNTFVRGTCTPPSALLVITITRVSKQASIFICPINKHKDIISMNNVQGQAARKAHKAQHCWPPCKKI